ncbi:hypothetical protein DOT_6196 [Desulfosporosinus sp. OT]|nr:hypothetical protein DOT_6196 [Desulfosporosinus sp. OT]
MKKIPCPKLLSFGQYKVIKIYKKRPLPVNSGKGLAYNLIVANKAGGF